jgi:hypothetical protein
MIVTNLNKHHHHHYHHHYHHYYYHCYRHHHHHCHHHYHYLHHHYQVNATATVRADLLYREAIMNVGESYGTVYMVFILIHPCIYAHLHMNILSYIDLCMCVKKCILIRMYLYINVSTHVRP